MDASYSLRIFHVLAAMMRTVSVLLLQTRHTFLRGAQILFLASVILVHLDREIQ